MLTITLLCNLGMSTSMLVGGISKAANAKGIEVDVDAFPFDKVGGRLDQTEVLLLGPQIRYMLPKFKEKYQSKMKYIGSINMTDYALMDGEKILNHVLEQIK